MTGLKDRLRAIAGGWKARLLAAGAFFLGLLQLYSPETLANLVPADYQKYAVVGIGVLIYVVRELTDGAVDQKG